MHQNHTDIQSENGEDNTPVISVERFIENRSRSRRLGFIGMVIWTILLIYLLIANPFWMSLFIGGAGLLLFILLRSEL